MQHSGNREVLHENILAGAFGGHIVAKDVPRTLKEIQGRKAETTDPDLLDLLSELEGWLKKIRAVGKDLVLFYY